jgi:hypothetical protein
VDVFSLFPTLLAFPAGRPVRQPTRSTRFEHVRFNRMHAKVTYKGPPVSINEFGLVLDNRVYRNVEGGWRTVFNRCDLLRQHHELRSKLANEPSLATFVAATAGNWHE